MMATDYMNMSYGRLPSIYPAASVHLSTSTEVTDSAPSTSSSFRTSSATTPSSAASQHCCENGRPVMTDSRTGQRICSCQYSSLLLSSYTRLPLASNIFGPGSSYPTRSHPTFTAPPTESPTLYTPLGANGSNIRDGCDTWRPLTQPSSLCDTSSIGFYPYGSSYSGLDMSARRKNATRESTNTLKVWLQEHIKNPYPTKGEKIMLAIITRMTLTQVSTWFANARRRLKKDNKLTWSPRNRSEDDEDEEDDENTACRDDIKKNNNINKESDVHIDVNTLSSDVTHFTETLPKVPAISSIENEVSTCRLSPDPSQDLANNSGYRASVNADGDKLKIWSVSDFLGTDPIIEKDSSVISISKLSVVKPSSGEDSADNLTDARVNILCGASSGNSGGVSAICVPRPDISTYSRSIGYEGGAYPYPLATFGGKFVKPAFAPALSKFSAFPYVRCQRVDSTTEPRRTIPFSAEGE